MIRPLLLGLLLVATTAGDTVEPKLSLNANRPWPGPDFWTNPAEDWLLEQGRIENRFSGGNRNVVVLTAELTPARQAFGVRVRVDQISFELRGNGYVGFELGRQGRLGDYRDAAVYGAGLPAGIDFEGRPFIGRPATDGAAVPLPLRNVVLEFRAEPAPAPHYQCTLRVVDPVGTELASTRALVHGSRLEGLVALMATTQMPRSIDPGAPRPDNAAPIAKQRGDEGRFAFSDLILSGDKVKASSERAFGPILWATHTHSNNGVLQVLAQAALFSRHEKLEATLELPHRDPVPAFVDPDSRTVRFRVRKVPTNAAIPYKITLAGGTFEGTLPPIPSGRSVTVASMSCNDATGFPHPDLVANVRAHKPDLLSFHGDQIYENIGGYGLIYDQRPNDRAVQSYLRKYMLHGWTWRDLLRDTPSITIPDDHDVFHGNLWGNEGSAADISDGFGDAAQDSGGYKMSVDFVNVVHRTQTGNLPEPADPAPCRSGISVYFTRFDFGPLDIAILADRQFKSAPRESLPRAEIENGWAANPDWDPVNDPTPAEANLLGPRQEAFLRRWVRAPAKDTTFRIAISQTPWCAPQTLPRDVHNDREVPELTIYKDGEYPPDDEPKADYDTNGWPPEARRRALALLGEAHAVHLTGDQHLGTTGQYGLDHWNDGPWWLSTPAIANLWPRRWMPAEEGRNRRPGDPKWLGEFRDGFGNPITLHAVANPRDIPREPARLFDRAVGYAISTWDPSTGQVVLANWPYWASPERPEPDNRPYPGWPIVIDPESGKRVR